MLKSARANTHNPTQSPAPVQTSQSPPVPPPRKPRSPYPTASNSGSLISLTQQPPPTANNASTTLSSTPPERATAAATTTTKPSPPTSVHIPASAAAYSVEMPRKTTFQDSLKALSKTFRSSHQDVRSPAPNEPPAIPLANKFNVLPVDEEDASVTSPTASRIVHTPAAGKHMPPHRSASFSQIDYSSGKYIRSALGALKASIMKHKEPSVVDSANLTLPRKRDGRDATYSDFARRQQPETVHEGADTSFEDDDSVSYIFLTDKPDRNVGHANTVPASPAGQSPPTDPSPLVVLNASETVLDTLCEEEICAQPQPCDEEFLQTATTCLIPVPVYECVGRDWPSADDEPEVWMNVREDDGVKHIEEYNVNTERITSAEIRMELVADMLPVLNEEDAFGLTEYSSSFSAAASVAPTIDIQTIAGDDDLDYATATTTTTHKPPATSKHNKFERSNTWSCPPSEVENVADTLPAISVTSGSSNEFDEPCCNVDAAPPDAAKTTDSLNRLSTEFVEVVRKRHSNEDKDKFESSLESINPSPNEERKRIDKSKRRKGIYIQWPPEDGSIKHDKHDSMDGWSLAGGENGSPIAEATASIWSGE